MAPRYKVTLTKEERKQLEALSHSTTQPYRVVERAKQKGRNPQTGQTLTIPAHNVVKFRPGKKLCVRVRE